MVRCRRRTVVAGRTRLTLRVSESKTGFTDRGHEASRPTEFLPSSPSSSSSSAARGSATTIRQSATKIADTIGRLAPRGEGVTRRSREGPDRAERAVLRGRPTLDRRAAADVIDDGRRIRWCQSDEGRPFG